MRLTTLLTPGALPNAINLRLEAAKAISTCEVVAGRTPGGRTRNAGQLAAFFTDCATKAAAVADETAPTIATRVAVSATSLRITFSEPMDTTVAPLPAAFTSSGNTVTAVAWGSGGDAGNLMLTGTGFAAGDSITYTQPAVNALRDRAGNLVATSTANMS